MSTETFVPSIWTRERIYTNPDLAFLPVPPHPTMGRFTPEFLAELDRETKWVPLEERPLLPREDWEPVGTQAKPCPHCRGKYALSLLFRGEATGIEMYRRVRCACPYLLHFWRLWRHVPQRFRDARLDSIAPRACKGITESRQAAILAALRAKPRDSYFLFGPPGTGKTMFSTALYRIAVQDAAEERYERDDWSERGPVWRIQASTMLREHSEWNSRDRNEGEVPLPSVRIEDIERLAGRGYRPRLFLDELDKVALTDARIDYLTAIVDAIYVAKGQIVATSNMSHEDLVRKWGADVANTVLRRIGGDDGAHSIRFAG